MSAEVVYKLLGVASYLGVLLLIGILASRRMKNLRDFFAAGKELGFLSAAFSARATGESAWLLLGLTGMGAMVGVRAFWVVLGEVIGVGCAWLFLARRFKRLTDRYDSLTVPDYLESRFRDGSQRLRLVAAGALTVFVTIYVSAQIHATGQTIETFLGWNYYIGAILGFAVVLLYTTAGGLLAVVWSDVFQGTMMVVGLVLLPVVGLIAAGGIEPVLSGLRDQDPALLSLAGSDGWTLIGVAGTLAFLCIGLGFMGSPQVFVRFLALRSEKEIGKGTLVAITWTILADSGAVLIGMVGRHSLGITGEDVLPGLVDHLMPALLVGLYIAIVLAATMSTVDSLLVVASSAAVRDYYQKVRHPELTGESLLALSRKATVIIAVVSLLVTLIVAASTGRQTVFWYVIFGWSGIAATFCPTVILSLFWRGFTSRGALFAMIAGFFSVPLFKFGFPFLPFVGPFFGALEELPPAFLVSGLTGILVSLGDKKGAQKLRSEVSQDFFAAASEEPTE